MEEATNLQLDSAIAKPEGLQIETLQVGQKLLITSIPIDRMADCSYGECFGAIDKILAETDGVIMEYFPDEINKMKYNPLVVTMTNFEEITWFFGEITERMRGYPDKKIYVFDPAHDENFSIIRLSPLAVAAAGGSLMIRSAEKKNRNAEQYKLPRRDFLKWMAGAMGTVLFGGGLASSQIWDINHVTNWSHNIPIPTEDTFRRTIVTEGIFTLSRLLETDTGIDKLNLALIYPPQHWAEIKERLSNGKKQKNDFEMCSLFKLVPALDESFFRGRIYKYNHGNFNLERYIKI